MAGAKGHGPKDPLDLLLGQRLRQLREERGLSPERLGEGLGVPAEQILRYETGRSRLYISRLFRLSQQLGVSPMDFYDGIAAPDVDGRLDQRPGESPDPSEPEAEGEGHPAERRDQRLLRGLIDGGDES